MRLCCDKENAVGPEGLSLLSTTADNHMACTINFLVVVTRGSLSYPFRYLGLFRTVIANLSFILS